MRVNHCWDLMVIKCFMVKVNWLYQKFSLMTHYTSNPITKIPRLWLSCPNASDPKKRSLLSVRHFLTFFKIFYVWFVYLRFHWIYCGAGRKMLDPFSLLLTMFVYLSCHMSLLHVYLCICNNLLTDTRHICHFDVLKSGFSC